MHTLLLPTYTQKLPPPLTPWINNASLLEQHDWVDSFDKTIGSTFMFNKTQTVMSMHTECGYNTQPDKRLIQ